MHAYGASEPWSDGSDAEADEGDHLLLRRQFWKMSRMSRPSSKQQRGKKGTKPLEDSSLFCTNCCRKGDKSATKGSTQTTASVNEDTRTSHKTTWIQCTECCDILNSWYCSRKCLKADEKRHQDECIAVTEDDDVRDIVQEFLAGPKIDDVSPAYFVGEHEDRQVEIRRWVDPLQPTANTSGVSCGSRDSSGTRPYPVPTFLPELTDPLREWRERFAPEATACCQPWVSLGTPTSVVVSWLPPKSAGRNVTGAQFSLQLQTLDDGTGAIHATWHACPEPHQGSVPSHVVNGLTRGEWVQFRVGIVRGDGTGVEYSTPSRPFQVGYADYYAVVPPVSDRTVAPPTSDFSPDEIKFFQTLETPGAIQEYLDSIPMNHEIQDDTCLSALESVRQNQAHCIEGAMLGAYILSLHGFCPYLMDLRACSADDDHIVTPFRIGRRWGCLSVSNHASLRYRNPVYRTFRELMMSYFDDYMNGKGERTLRAYSLPINLRTVFGNAWHARRGDVYEIAEFLDSVKHYLLVDEATVGPHLRAADEMILATTVEQREWQAPDNFDEEQVRRNENK
eukprot:m.848481 g.848481  ORF g.848481 m.848481 type:complete len:563 (-) comp23488_c0_seq3:95-1783(-)